MQATWKQRRRTALRRGPQETGAQAPPHLCSPFCSRRTSAWRPDSFTFQIIMSQCCPTGSEPSGELSGLIVPRCPSDSIGSVFPVSRAVRHACFLTPPASIINPEHGGPGLPGVRFFRLSHIRGMSAQWVCLSASTGLGSDPAAFLKLSQLV